MQDYKERIANAWKASDKPPKEWISNHTLNIVREARMNSHESAICQVLL